MVVDQKDAHSETAQLEIAQQPSTSTVGTNRERSDMSILNGLTTLVLTAEDVEAAGVWYSDLLGAEPYFRQPEEGPAASLEFRIGPDEDELGIMNRAYSPEGTTPGSSSVTYWHVDDVEAAVTQLVDHGAQPHAPVTPRGPEFVTASVTDPFGNVIGLMYSPHWSGQH